MVGSCVFRGPKILILKRFWNLWMENRDPTTTEPTPQSRRSDCDPDCPLQTPNRAFGPKWEKNGRKMDFGPTAKEGEKMAEKWENGHFDRFLGKCSHFSAIFPPFSRPKSIFSHFGPEARFGVCTGQSGSQHSESGSFDPRIT